MRATARRCPSARSGVTNSRNPPTIHHQSIGTSHGTGRTTGGDVVEERQPHHPLQAGQRGQRQRQSRPATACGQPRHRLHHAGLDPRRRVELVEVTGQRTRAGGGRRGRRPSPAGSAARSAATSCAADSEPPPSAKKSASGPSTGAASTSRHRPGQPAHRAAEVGCFARSGVAGDRPRQRVAVDLARGAGGQLVDEHQARHQRGGQRRSQRRAGRRHVEATGRRWRCSRPAGECRLRSAVPPPPRR